MFNVSIINLQFSIHFVQATMSLWIAFHLLDFWVWHIVNQWQYMNNRCPHLKTFLYCKNIIFFTLTNKDNHQDEQCCFLSWWSNNNSHLEFFRRHHRPQHLCLSIINENNTKHQLWLPPGRFLIGEDTRFSVSCPSLVGLVPAEKSCEGGWKMIK